MGVNDNNKLYSWSITCTDYSQIHISRSLKVNYGYITF